METEDVSNKRLVTLFSMSMIAEQLKNSCVSQICVTCYTTNLQLESVLKNVPHIGPRHSDIIVTGVIKRLLDFRLT